MEKYQPGFNPHTALAIECALYIKLCLQWITATEVVEALASEAFPAVILSFLIVHALKNIVRRKTACY